MNPSRFRTLLAAAAFSLLAPFSASAASVLFDDDFADITITQSNFSSFDNFTVTNGFVDVFVNGGFSLPCPSLGCVDLDGSAANAARLESGEFSLLSGATYTLSLNVAGNQRVATPDFFTFGLFNDDGVLGSDSATITVFEAYHVLSVAITATANTTAKIFIDHAGGDNFGILLDRVTLSASDVTAVPLPAALPLLGLGLAGLGLMKRRRK